MKNYSIWGVVLTEVEVDILTGEKHIKRCDLIEDAGLSTSPLVSIFFKDYRLVEHNLKDYKILERY